MMKKLFGFMLLTALFLGLTAQAAQARQRTVLQKRYEMTKPSSEVFTHRKYTGDKSVFEGYKRIQVKDLPLRYQKLPAWNEFGRDARVIYLGDNLEAWIYVDPGSWTLGYLEGCRTPSGGVTFNRLKWATNPLEPETTTLVLECWDLNRNSVKDPTEDKNGDGEWNLDDCHTATVIVRECWDTDQDGVRDDSEDVNRDQKWDVNDCRKVAVKKCPKITIQPYATRGEKLKGGLLAYGLSMGEALLESGLGSSSGHKGKAMLYSGVVTTIKQRGVQYVNASDNEAEIVVTLDGNTTTYKLKRNKSVELVGVGTAVWDDGKIRVDFVDGFEECFASASPKRTINLESSAVIIRDGKRQTKLKPIKDQDELVIAPDERRGDRRNNGGGQRALAPTDGGGQVRNSSGSRWNKAMKPNN